MAKKIYILSLILTALIFFGTYSTHINYGLPYFFNNDEGAFLKSSLFFYKFFSQDYKYLGDPFFAPLLNFIIVSLIALTHGLLSFDITNLAKKIYFDPSLIIIFGRLASLIICTISIFFFYLISKKLKISRIFILGLLINLCFSFFYLDIAIVNGKNSYYLLFFLLQYYFFIKYFLKIKKFNCNSYFLIGFIGACAWGINYFCAIVSLYAILILHIKKFKTKRLIYLFYFFLVFFIVGIIPSLILTETSIFTYITDSHSGGKYVFNFSDRIFSILDSLDRSFKIIFFTEKYLFLFLLFLMPFYLYGSNFSQKSLFVFSFILLFEPIIILILSSDAAFPQLKYFSASIVIIFILIGIILQQLTKKYDEKKIFIIFSILALIVFFNKLTLFNDVTKILSNKYNFYETLEDERLKNNLNELIIFEPHISIRKSLENLNLYIDLHNNNLVSTKWYQKDTLQSLENKTKKFDKNFFKTYKNIPNILFIEKSFDIKDFDSFFNFIKKEKKINYILIPNYQLFENEDLNLEKIKYIQSNFRSLEKFKSGDLITARDLIEKIYLGKKTDLANITRIGPTYEIFEINK